MARVHTLYAYVEGREFDSIAEPITERFLHFVASRGWISGDAWPVNQKRESEDGDYDWELGMNLELPNPYEEPSGWFSDIEEVAVFCRELASEFPIEFVIGIAKTEGKISEDLFFVDSGPLDIEALHTIIGDAPPPEGLTRR